MRAKGEDASGAQERFLVVVVLVLICIMAARTPLDSDLWWHLRAGEMSWTAKQPLRIDMTSYTRDGAGWINHSWLTQVILYLAYAVAGYLGLTLVVVVVVGLSMWFVWLCMEGRAILRAFLLIFGGVVASVVWSARPQIFSLVLMGCCGWILYRYKWRQKNALWALPLVFILWSNLHAGYPLGLMLIGLMVVGEILNHFVGNNEFPLLSYRAIIRLVVWGLVSTVALLVNPNFVETWFIPFKTVGVEALGGLVSEWQSPDFHQAFQQPFLLLLFGVFIVLALSRRVDVTDLLSVSWFAALALVARRNFAPFALVAVPVLSRYLWRLIQNWHQPSWQFDRAAKSYRYVNLAFVALLCFAAIVKLYAVSYPPLVEAYQRQLYPVGAVEWLAKEHPVGRLFNEYNWGGYLSWVLRDYPIFIDGRTDLYGDVIIRQWVEVISAGENWENLLDEWQIRLLLLSPERPLARVLEYHPEWQVGYRDSLCVVYVRNAP